MFIRLHVYILLNLNVYKKRLHTFLFMFIVAIIQMRNPHNKKKLQKKKQRSMTFSRLRYFEYSELTTPYNDTCYFSVIAIRKKLINLNEDEIDSLIQVFIIKRIQF